MSEETSPENAYNIPDEAHGPPVAPPRQSNAVFGGQPNNPMTPPSDDIPFEMSPLPSNGIIYPPGSPIHKAEQVPVKVMTTKEEDLLTSPALINSGKAIQSLLESCMMDRNIDVNEMIAGDRNAVMVTIRIIGYGARYVGKVDCSKCGEEYENEFDLNKLEIKRLDISPVEEGMNLFRYNLPRSGVEVLFKFISGYDEEEIDKATERRKKIGQRGDHRVTDRLRYSIVEYDGSRKRGDIERVVQRMAAYDSLCLRKYMTKHEPGIDMEQEVECPHCSHQEEVRMPIGIGFFYPPEPE